MKMTGCAFNRGRIFIRVLFSRLMPAVHSGAMMTLLGTLIFMMIMSPLSAIGQSARGKLTNEDEFKEKRFLQRGKLKPQDLSPEELQEMAGFATSVVSYQVHVLGEVARPGTLRVNPSTRVDEALKKAGGVNELGSNKKIKIKRAGGKEIIVDITDFRRNGNLASNPYLLDNDVIFVPFAQKFVRLEGATYINGVVELGDERTLADALKMTGGTTVDVLADEPITVVRYDSSGNRELIKVQNDSASLNNFAVENGDLIFVPNVITKGKTFDFNMEDIPGGRTFYPSSTDAVFVIGAIGAPGAYPFDPFSSAEQYVLYAGPGKATSIEGMKINTIDGRRIRGRKACSKYKISPGDVIYVPEKAFTVDKTLMWYNTIASTIMTGFAMQQLIKSWK